MRKLIKDHWILIVIFLLTLYALCPYFESDLIIGMGESAFSINPAIMQLQYSWNDRYGFSNTYQPHLILFGFVWGLLSVFSEVIHPSVILVFLSFVISGASLYLLLIDVFGSKNKSIFLPACLLYTFNIFRICVGYSNPVVANVFMSMPLFLLVYRRMLLYKKWIYVVMLSLLSVLFSSINGNLALGLVNYFLLLLYLIFYLLYRKNVDVKKLVVLHFGCLLLGVALNFYWVAPVYEFYTQVYSVSEGNFWNVIGAGKIYDNFRFMGFWAFLSGYGGKKYFPFSQNYYKLPLLLSSYIVVVVTFYHFLVRKFSKKNRKYVRAFIVFFAAIAFVMVVGAKGPLSFVYTFLYEHVPLVKAYREPYTKFMPMFILASCLSLVLSVEYIVSLLEGKFLKKVFPSMISLLVLLNAYPVFTRQIIHKKRWVQGPAGHVVVIPDYWKSAKRYIEKIPYDEKITISPYNPYVLKSNWEYGVNASGSVADYIVDSSFIKSWISPKSPVAYLVEDVYEAYIPHGFSLGKYLGLLNSRQVFQLNDTEWRYNSKIDSPSESKKLLKDHGFSEERSFGYYDEAYLEKLQNEEEEDISLKNALYVELYKEPVLILFKSKEDSYIPHFYVPKRTVCSVDGDNTLLNLVALENDQEIRTQYIMKPFFEGIAVPSEITDTLLAESQAEYYFGEKIDHNEFELDTLKWPINWDWPDPENNPEQKFMYALVKLKERLLILIETDPVLKIDKSSWLAAKRVSEMSKYEISTETKSRLFKDYKKLITDAIKLTKDIDKQLESGRIGEEEYWKILERMYVYLARSVLELDTAGVKEADMQEVYRIASDYVTWIKSKIENNANLLDYAFNVDSGGKYELFGNLDGDSWKYIDSVELARNEPIDMSKYIAEGFGLIESKADFGEDTIARLVKVDNWVPGSKYRLSFDYVAKNSAVEVKVLEDHYDYSGLSLGESVDWNSILMSREENVERKLVYKEEVLGLQMCIERSKSSYKLSNKCRSRYDLTVEANTGSINGYFVIEIPIEASVRSHTEVENIRVYKESKPQFVLKKVGSEVKDVNIPQISFTKINPTQYFLRVKGASEKYNLVFSENYDPKWQVFLLDDFMSESSGSILSRFLKLLVSKIKKEELCFDDYFKNEIASYFDGDIVEYARNNEFLGSYSFTNVGRKAISLDKHYLANGYANAWEIKPEDTNFLEDYNLIIEYKPQSRYVLAIFISVILTCSSVVYLIGYMIFKVYKNRR
ncbi:hypothetical protein JXA34_01025 [Patescibacteria group bacterium]|nr:hypothetical protein [Patescibacteria group bacterium]